MRKPLDDQVLEQFQEDFFGEMRHEYYRFFYHMVAELKPRIALEIGIDHGHTLAHMAAANLETTVIGIDRRNQCAKDMPDYPNVRLIYGNSQDKETEYAVRNIIGGKNGGEIGIVFQDSSHHYDASHKEFDMYSKFLPKNGIWCCDDITEAFYNPDVDPTNKGMIQYFEELPGRKKLYDNLHYGSTIGVVLL